MAAWEDETDRRRGGGDQHQQGGQQSLPSEPVSQVSADDAAERPRDEADQEADVGEEQPAGFSLAHDVDR